MLGYIAFKRTYVYEFYSGFITIIHFLMQRMPPNAT